jgi:alkaline phosphatase D
MPIRLTRRAALTGAAASTALVAAPGLLRAAQRPSFTHGLQSGDVSADGGVIWARADRPSRMLVEVATTESFRDARRVQPLDLTAATDFSGKMTLEGLPAGQQVFYRVRLADLASINDESEPAVGRFRTAPAGRRPIRFVWSGDTAGQGWGIDESRGGMKTYATMLGRDPDFFIHSGDTIYADGPLQETVELPDGGVWRNVMTEAKAKVAETLPEFRGNFLYNLLDENVRAFNAATPMMAQWDDHEVTNNWWPNELLEADDRYTVKSAALLAARGNRAFREMMPLRESWVEPGRIYRKIAYGPLLDVFFLDMRSYRGDNSANDQTERTPATAFLGPEQIAWLKRELTNSRALWKVIASDMPIGMIVRDGSEAFENGANGDGPARGRELDIADILRFIKHAGVANTVWLTADVHYTAAHRYSPERARFQDFDPFWEFVSGPIHAGTFGPNDYDDTFGPEVVFAKHPSEEQGLNLPPSMGLQFFGEVEIAPEGPMTVTLRDRDDAALWSTTLEPKRG